MGIHHGWREFGGCIARSNASSCRSQNMRKKMVNKIENKSLQKKLCCVLEPGAKEVVRWNFYFVSNKQLSGNKENSCKIPLTRIWLADDVYSDSKVITSAVTSRISQLRPDGPKFRRVDYHTHFFTSITAEILARLIQNIYVIVNWNLSKQGIRWPSSCDHFQTPV